MFDYAERYGHRFVKLTDSRATEKEFEFDQMLLMPTARGYRALVEQAKVEIDPWVMSRLSKVWPPSTIENLSFFAMAAAVYARSVADPPYAIDVGKVLLKTAAFCRLRCNRRKGTGGGCMAAMGSGHHKLPKCVKLPRDVEAAWRDLKRYIATGAVPGPEGEARAHEAMKVKIDLRSDYYPVTSC
ncbi:MAG TPA: hypothetical protein PLK94_07560 [Alphaproteobacteria bacterium]|nr:hypothetical protein [Alphaproteobacteria bacterium]